jgi:L-iditol 2-dehydrogenase
MNGEVYQLSLAGDRAIEARQTPIARPAAKQVLVATEIVGICATDVALFNGSYGAPHKSPLCFGHEWSGRVEEVGSGVTHWRPGDRVTGDCSLWCGHCTRCRSDKNLCSNIEKFGITVDGAARPRFIIDAKYLHGASASVPPELLALAEPLSVCARGLHAARCENLAANRVLIIGGGMLGLGCLILLRHLHQATEVFLADLEHSRQARAVSLGAKIPEFPAASAADVADYASLYDSSGFDLVIETTGSADAFRQALSVTNPRGTVVLLGFTPVTQFPVKQVVTKGLRIAGSIGGSGSFERIVPWLESHGEVARPLLGPNFPAANAMAAFVAAQDRNLAPKIQLRFQA